ncbi:MAG: type II toxin-antitoxin system VapC family toxin [Deltaproteobacteria bacterium]|nr:type II toxin-antitoxin system VapC family toxin [Deltaproteobacteria bacterium]
MKPTVYIETSVISYLAARPSRDLITAANQQLTHVWWRVRRPSFEVFASHLVVDEASAGDPEASRHRQEILADLPLLEATEEAQALALDLLRETPLPPPATPDALHIALAVVHGMDYLLTWNCRHLANAELRPRIERTCKALGFRPAVMCTPAELMGGEE